MKEKRKGRKERKWKRERIGENSGKIKLSK